MTATVNCIVVAHPDDEILGFGAAGAKLVERGEIVQPVILCGQADVRTRRPSDSELYDDIRAANAAVGFSEPILGSFSNIRMNVIAHVELVQFIEAQVERFQPTRIFTHHPGDLNDDHGQAARACLAASRLWQRKPGLAPVESVHLIEIQSATDWSYDYDGDGFRPNLFVEIEHQLDAKLEALACYRNVMREYPHPRSAEAIRGLAAYRGAQSGQRYAEAFQTIFRRELA